MNMKLRYRLFLRRKRVYYAFDDLTKTFTSLKTKDKAEANRPLMAIPTVVLLDGGGYTMTLLWRTIVGSTF